MHAEEESGIENSAVTWPSQLAETLTTLSEVLKGLLDKPVADPDALLTSEQLSDLLQVPARTLRDQAAAGQIPHHRLGKHYRFSRGDIAKILQTTQQTQTPEPRRPHPRRQ